MTNNPDNSADFVTEPGGLAVLEKTLAAAPRKGLPPVHLWNPPYCGDIGLKIARDGAWYYQGSPIGRARLRRLFASVLRKDDDGHHYLVTPVEKIGIEVEDAPFLAVDMTVTGSGCDQLVTLLTNLDEEVRLGAAHPLRVSNQPPPDGLKLYILVRGRLEALFTRALIYDLVALAVETDIKDERRFGVWSDGVFFDLGSRGDE